MRRNEGCLALGPSYQETAGTKSTKLAIVREALRTNPDAFYAGELIKDEGTKPVAVNCSPSSRWSETVDIIVSPRTPIFDPSDLNKFMLGLDKPIFSMLRELDRNIEPTLFDGAYSDYDGGIKLGQITYDEPFARIQTHIQKTITSSDPAAIARLNMLTGISENDLDEQVWRRIWVRVYPEPMVARILFELESGAYNGTLRYVQGEGLEDLVGGKYRLCGHIIERLKDYYSKQPGSRKAGFLTEPGQ